MLDAVIPREEQARTHDACAGIRVKRRKERGKAVGSHEHVIIQEQQLVARRVSHGPVVGRREAQVQFIPHEAHRNGPVTERHP